jgi:acyl-CoA reductase-like NAD-dependent aldehyde dehydrogenase
VSAQHLLGGPPDGGVFRTELADHLVEVCLAAVARGVVARTDGARVVTGERRLLTETGGYFTDATVVDDVTPR